MTASFSRSLTAASGCCGILILSRLVDNIKTVRYSCHAASWHFRAYLSSINSHCSKGLAGLSHPSRLEMPCPCKGCIRIPAQNVMARVHSPLASFRGFSISILPSAGLLPLFPARQYGIFNVRLWDCLTGGMGILTVSLA